VVHSDRAKHTYLSPQVGNSRNSAASSATNIEESQQPPPFSQDPDISQLEPNTWADTLRQLALLNLTVNDAPSQLTSNQEPLEPTPPPASAPNLPLPLTTTSDIEVILHGAGYSLDFRRSLDLHIGQLKQDVSQKISTLGVQIPAAEITLAFKGTIMEDTTVLRDYNLQQNAFNITDLTISMRGAATPSNAPHTPPSPDEMLPMDIDLPDLPSIINTNDPTSSSEDADSPSTPEPTATKVNYCGKILDDYSSAVPQPELSAVITVMAQLSAIASQRAPMTQRQVMWAPNDQIMNAPLQLTSAPLELDNGAGLEEPDELTQPPTGLGEPLTETMVPVPHAHEPPLQGASFDTPTQRISTFTVLNDLGHEFSFILSPDTTIAFLKQAIQRATGVSTSRQVLSSQGKEMHGSEMLRDHNLTPSSSIELTIKLITEMIQFLVRTPDGSFITMLDSIDTTGGQLKARLEGKTGILAAQQILTHTEEIPDSTTLREITLPPMGTIYMSLRLTGGAEKERALTPTQPQKMDTEMVQFFVQNLNGSSLTMREPYDTTGGQLKGRVQIRTGIPAAQLRLTYTGDIQDPNTLREISLPNNGTIRISLRMLGGMENAATTRQIRGDTIYARDIGIAVTQTPQGYEITNITPNSPADKEKQISQGHLLIKIDDSFSNLRNLDRAREALNGIPNTQVLLSLKTKLNPKLFHVSLVRQQNHPSGPTIDADGESPGSPSHASIPKRARQIKSPYDTSSPITNPAQRPETVPQPPSQDQAYTRALLDSIHSLSEGQSKNRFILQRQLARKFYQELSHIGTGAEIKQHLQQQYGVWGAFSQFLKACTHPNGEPLLEWKDNTLAELRITVPTKAPMTTLRVSGLTSKAPAGGLPLRPEVPQGCSRSKPKKPRLATNTSPPSTQAPEGELPPPAKANLIRSFCVLWVPGFAPKTAKDLRLAVERHLRLAEDTYLPFQRDLVCCYNKLAKLHRERSNNGKPQPVWNDMEQCLELNRQGRVYRRSTTFAFRQTLPNGQGHQDYHEGDFVHIRQHNSSQTQLVQIMYALDPTPPTTGETKKTLLLSQALTVQPWTDSNGQYLQDKTGRLYITANQVWRRQTIAFPDTTLDPDPFLEIAAQFSHLTYLDLLMVMRVTTTWKQSALKVMKHLRTLSLNPASTVRDLRWLPQAADDALTLALQRTEPQRLRVIDLRSQSSISPPAIRKMLENHPGLEHVLISNSALAFTAVATKMTTLPGLRGQRPRLLSNALLALIESKERATAEADIDPQEGPTSIKYLLDELALLPGTQLSIDPELVPPLYILHDAAKENDWATIALFVHGRLGIERARRDTQAPDRQGATALHIACEHGSSEAVETLLSDPNPSVAHAISKSNLIADTPIMAACRGGHADIVTRLPYSAPPTTDALNLTRKVRYDGHTFLTATIASQNSSLLQLTLDQPPFALIDSNQLNGATTYPGKLRALANAATCPLQLEEWLRKTKQLVDNPATRRQQAKHSVLRTLAVIIDAPPVPTPLRTALTNTLAIMAQHWSILANPHQRSPLQRYRFGAQYALPLPPSILLAQLGAQGQGKSMSLPSPNLTRDSYLPTRIISPRRESRPHNPTKDILTSKNTTMRMALSHDSHTLVRQETDMLMTVDTATGLTTALRTTKHILQDGGISALNFIGLQCEDPPTAAGHLSVILVDEKGTIFRWVPVENTLLADHQHTDLPDTAARQAGAVSFTRNASALAFISQEGTLHISHFRSAGEDGDPTAAITVRHNFSRRPVSKQGTHTMALSNSMLALSTTSGTTLWEGVHRDSHTKDGAADFICRRVLDGHHDEKDQRKPRREPRTLAFSGNGEYLTTGCRGDRLGYDVTGSVIDIWNVVIGTLTFQLRATHQKGVHVLVFSTDTLLVSAGHPTGICEDHVMQVWHLDIHAAKLQVQQGDTHTAMHNTPLGHHAKITDLVASERLIIASSVDRTTRIWNVPHAPPKSKAHKEEVKAVAISPSHANSNSIFGTAATAAGQTVKIWDAQDTLLATLPHTTEVRAITFSASGEHLVVAGNVPHIHIHASSTGDLLLRIASPEPSQSSTAYFTTLAVPENDKYLAAGTSSGAIAIWTNDIPPLQCQRRPQAHRRLEMQTGPPTCKHIAGNRM
jgi:WD40 repeat protein